MSSMNNEESTGGALYRILIYHMRRKGIYLGANNLQGTN